MRKRAIGTDLESVSHRSPRYRPGLSGRQARRIPIATPGGAEVSFAAYLLQMLMRRVEALTVGAMMRRAKPKGLAWQWTRVEILAGSSVSGRTRTTRRGCRQA